MCWLFATRPRLPSWLRGPCSSGYHSWFDDDGILLLLSLNSLHGSAPCRYGSDSWVRSGPCRRPFAGRGCLRRIVSVFAQIVSLACLGKLHFHGELLEEFLHGYLLPRNATKSIYAKYNNVLLHKLIQIHSRILVAIAITHIYHCIKGCT